MDYRPAVSFAHVLAKETATPWAQRIKLWREQRGLSQAALASLLDVNRVTVAEWESGRKTPTDERPYVNALAERQLQRGENPGHDSMTAVRSLWDA